MNYNLFYLLLFLVISCKNAPKETTKVTTKADSIEINTAEIKSPIFKNESFIKYFAQAQKERAIVKLPEQVIEQSFNFDYTPDHHIKQTFAVDFLKMNDQQTLLLYSVECTSGGYCTRYYLAIAKKDESDKETISNYQAIGMESGSLYETEIFEYSFKNPDKITVAQTYKVVDDDEKLVSEDTERWKVEIDEVGEIKKIKL